MKTIYKTERLVLKVLNPSSEEAVLDYYLRNREFLEPWEPLRDEDFFTREYHREQLIDEYDNIQKGNSLRFWIFKKEDENKIIGTICFSNIIRGCFQSCYLGYKLDQEEINQGYMTEAIKTGIDIIFHDYHLHRIEANIMPGNVRSLRVAEKLGFENEGLAHRYIKINGKWEDHVHMVLLNEAVAF